MKKISGYKWFIGIVIVVIIVLVAFNIAAARLIKLNPCGDEQDHFVDESGNGYCIAKELVQDFENTPVITLGNDNEQGQN